MRKGTVFEFFKMNLYNFFEIFGLAQFPNGTFGKGENEITTFYVTLHTSSGLGLMF